MKELGLYAVFVAFLILTLLVLNSARCLPGRRVLFACFMGGCLLCLSSVVSGRSAPPDGLPFCLGMAVMGALALWLSKGERAFWKRCCTAILVVGVTLSILQVVTPYVHGR